MKKRILSILLVCCMMLTMLPTTAFATLSDSLGNTPKENQAILEQLSALTGGSSDQVLSTLNALGLLDEAGNFKVDQTITLSARGWSAPVSHREIAWRDTPSRSARSC